MQFYCAQDVGQKLHNSTCTISLQFVAGMLLGFVIKAEKTVHQLLQHNVCDCENWLLIRLG